MSRHRGLCLTSVATASARPSPDVRCTEATTRSARESTSAFTRSHGDAADPARPGDDGDLAGESHRMRPLRDLISSMNSARVSGRSRKAPSMAEVTALEFCFSTPRMSMHR